MEEMRGGEREEEIVRWAARKKLSEGRGKETRLCALKELTCARDRCSLFYSLFFVVT